MYEQVLALLEEKKYPELKALLSEMNEADIAAVFMPLDRGGFGSALIALPVSIIFTSQVKNLQNTTKKRIPPNEKTVCASVYYNFRSSFSFKGQ